ncbi:MAG: DUF2752 domain-containing protein [Kiritimatiellaeota bacterium]|nr:DUF2752 domain-containing protein [Kiritimatiellota bacterium]
MRIGWTSPPPLRVILQTLRTLLVCGLGVCVLHGLGVQVCLLKRLTGVPCFLCGSTRAALALLRGGVPDALRMQPLMTILMLLAVPLGGGYVVSALFLRRVPSVRLTRLEVHVAIVLAVLLLLLNWLWLLRHRM